MASKNKKSFSNFITIVFMVVFVGMVSVNFIVQNEKLKELEQQEQAIAQQIETENEKKLDLESQMNFVNSDAYIEKIAREQLGLIKSNERLFLNRENN